MRWAMPFFCIIEYDCGISIYMSDVFLPYIEEVIMYENDCYYLTKDTNFHLF